MTNIENAQIRDLSNHIEKQNIRLEAQNTRIEQTNAHVADMKTTLDTIQNALLGNTIAGDGGLVKRIKDTEDAVDILKKLFAGYRSTWAGVVWVVTVLSALIGLTITIWKNVFK